MPQFMVRISGENIKVRFTKRVWLFWTRDQVRDAGFVTTRFVESESANEAIEFVIDKITKELNAEKMTTENTVLELDKIKEDEDAFDLYAPGKGFTFY